MKGRNRYLDIRGSVQENFSNKGTLEGLIKEAAKASISKPCIFLSHKSEDKTAVKDIAKYIADAEIDYYLDEEDPELQKAVSHKDHRKITEFIELGINNSTHVLTLISEETKKSWWVPFEIGFGKKGEKDLALLPLKDVSYVPPFLAIVPKLNGIKGLNEYIDQIQQGISPFTKNAHGTLLLELIGRKKAPSYLTPDHPLKEHIKRSLS